MKKTLALSATVSLFALIATSAGASTSSKPAAPSTKVGYAVSAALPSNVANAQFLDQNGASVTLGGLRGDTVFVVPILTLCPDTCPFTTGNLLQLENQLTAHHDTKVDIVAITVDPYRDSVARLAAYASMVGANFSLWTPVGATTTAKATTKASGVGTGDKNANLTSVAKFFGWQAQITQQGKPAATDWMAPYAALTYDVSHSDGFFVINASQQLRFIATHAPQFHGTIATNLYNFMNEGGKYTMTHPTKNGWTVAQALQALSFVAGKQL